MISRFLSRKPELSIYAKVVHGRLTLYSGKNGVCNPSHATVSEELGISIRQVGRALKELSACGLISWRRTRTSSYYQVHPPSSYSAPKTSSSVQQADLDRSNRPTNKCSVINVNDYRLPIPIGTGGRDLPKSTPKIYAGLCEDLGTYLSKPVDTPYIVDCAVELVGMARGHGFDEPYVRTWLRDVWFERGIQPGTAYAPFHTNWFSIAFQEHLDKEETRREKYKPDGFQEWESRNAAKADKAMRVVA